MARFGGGRAAADRSLSARTHKTRTQSVFFFPHHANPKTAGQPLREHAAPYAYSPMGAPVAAPGADGLPPGEQPGAPPMMGGMMGGGGAMHRSAAPSRPPPPPPRRALRQAFAGAGLPGPGFDPFSFVANSMRYGPAAAFGFPSPPSNLVEAGDLGGGGPAAATPVSAPAPSPQVVPLAEAPAAGPPSSAPALAPSSAPAPSPSAGGPTPTVVPLK